MGKIFVVMGKSATGKDTVFKRLLEEKNLNLKTVVTYTTRPIRSGEKEGVEYFFTGENQLREWEKEKKIVEQRVYETVHGKWYYFMAADGQVDLNQQDYIIISTIDGYLGMKNFYGKEAVFPIYIEVENGIRLERALKREKGQKEPRYTELCRRFLADEEDFSEERRMELGINKVYRNENLGFCLKEIIEDIQKLKDMV